MCRTRIYFIVFYKTISDIVDWGNTFNIDFTMSMSKYFIVVTSYLNHGGLHFYMTEPFLTQRARQDILFQSMSSTNTQFEPLPPVHKPAEEAREVKPRK